MTFLAVAAITLLGASMVASLVSKPAAHGRTRRSRKTPPERAAAQGSIFDP